jgi:hypothetical protein
MARRIYLTLDRLEDLSPEGLRNEWARRYSAPAPNISPDLLRLGLGYRLQEKRLGGLSRETRSLLRQMARRAEVGEPTISPPRKLTPGTRLVRDWHGVGHTVTVLDNGFDYDGKTWRSLTAIARSITGTHWNGPCFFGLAGRRS